LLSAYVPIYFVNRELYELTPSPGGFATGHTTYACRKQKAGMS